MKLRSLANPVILSVALLTGCTGSTDQNETQAVTQAIQTNPVENSGIDKQVIDFLSSATEMRKMNTTWGELAQSKSETRALREYGALLVEDQAKILKDINALVESKKIVLPKFIDLQLNEELAYLRKKKGREFDRFFILQMIRRHQQEAEAFREALAFSDGDIKIFVLQNMPLIERNLKQLADLRIRN